MKRILLLSLCFMVFSSNCYAVENNKFGMGMVQPSDKDFENVEKLVNSNGGKWGYVTLVIQENDRNKKKWQEIFDKLRQHRLIPIIRLSTIPEGKNWKRPRPEDAREWVDFLDSLNWVVKSRYIVLFNEPNHGVEWGGAVDPNSYKDVVLSFSKALKERNAEYFVMMAGFDASAPTAMPNYLDEYDYLSQIVSKELFKNIDGWSSHSYPNPGFVGGVYDVGRGSVRTYQWEISRLAQLGIEKKLPVFITETGWPHRENISGKNYSYLSRDTASVYITKAFYDVWLPDDNVIAVTPFIFNYQGEPFDAFSWVRLGDSDFYPQYFAIQAMSKTEGNPEQFHKIYMTNKLPTEILEGSIYKFEFKLKNEGQSILDGDDGYRFVSDNNLSNISFSNFSKFIPYTDYTENIYLNTNSLKGQNVSNISLYKKSNKIVDIVSWKYNILPLPKVTIKVNLWFKSDKDDGQFEVQVFDKSEDLVFSEKNVQIKNGIGIIGKIKNVVLNEKYRMVILHPYYLPRQEYVVFRKDNNSVKFEQMWPLDFNLDGMFSMEDVFALLANVQLFKKL